MEPQLNSSNVNLYNAYYVKNSPDKKLILPQNCYGAIGITLDEKVMGIGHVVVNALNIFSLAVNGVQQQDPATGIGLDKFMHAFVVTNQFDPTGISVCEATGEGIRRAEVKIGDTDWTSMVLFVPKDLKISEKIVKNAQLELLADEAKKVGAYAYFSGLGSTLARKTGELLKLNNTIISSEMADFLKGRSIRDAGGSPKSTICSELAIRILRTSLLESKLTEEQIADYSTKNFSVIKTSLEKEMQSDSEFGQFYNSSRIFDREASMHALPYELYNILMQDSDFLGNDWQKTEKNTIKET